MVDTIMFDMGGTLEDIWYSEKTTRMAARRVQEMLAAAAGGDTQDEAAFCAQLMEGIAAYKAWSENNMRELKPEEIWPEYYLKSFAFPTDTVRAMAENLAGMWEVTFFQRELRPGVAKTLAALREKGYHMGVISNTASLYSVFDVLEAYGIRGFFSNITLSSVTGYRKPHGEIFKIALREMNADAAQCAYIGDTISRDISGARQAGFGKVIQIRSFLSGEKDKNVDATWQPDAVIEEIPDLLELF